MASSLQRLQQHQQCNPTIIIRHGLKSLGRHRRRYSCFPMLTTTPSTFALWKSYSGRQEDGAPSPSQQQQQQEQQRTRGTTRHNSLLLLSCLSSSFSSTSFSVHNNFFNDKTTTNTIDTSIGTYTPTTTVLSFSTNTTATMKAVLGFSIVTNSISSSTNGWQCVGQLLSSSSSLLTATATMPCLLTTILKWLLLGFHLDGGSNDDDGG